MSPGAVFVPVSYCEGHAKGWGGAVGEDIKNAREIRPGKFMSAEFKCLPAANHCMFLIASKQRAYICTMCELVTCYS